MITSGAGGLGSIDLGEGPVEKGVTYYKKPIEKNPGCHLDHVRLGRFYDEQRNTAMN